MRAGPASSLTLSTWLETRVGGYLKTQLRLSRCMPATARVRLPMSIALRHSGTSCGHYTMLEAIAALLVSSSDGRVQSFVRPRVSASQAVPTEGPTRLRVSTRKRTRDERQGGLSRNTTFDIVGLLLTMVVRWWPTMPWRAPDVHAPYASLF